MHDVEDQNTSTMPSSMPMSLRPPVPRCCAGVIMQTWAHRLDCRSCLSLLGKVKQSQKSATSSGLELQAVEAGKSMNV